MDRFFNNIAVQWALRRALELGGLFGTLAAFWMTLPPGYQAVIMQLIDGHWGDVTLKALVPVIVYLATQVWSFHSTTKPQIVTDEKVQVSTKRLPAAKRTYVNEAGTAAANKQPNPLQRWFGKT